MKKIRFTIACLQSLMMLSFLSAILFTLLSIYLFHLKGLYFFIFLFLSSILFFGIVRYLISRYIIHLNDSVTTQITDHKFAQSLSPEESQLLQQKIIRLETQKSLNSIVAGFAHEINNPLTGILGYIDLMEMNHDLSGSSQKRLCGIKEQAIRIRDVIDELNRLDPDIEPVKSPIDISNLLEKMLKIIKRSENARNITFETNLASANIIVCGNHFALYQVFDGIIENAMEAIIDRKIPEGKIKINLHSDLSKKNAIIEISDNAGGFENMDLVFNPFYTTKCRTLKKGIGFSIAFNLIQEHEGNIYISNRDSGAVVTVHLPLYINEDSCIDTQKK